MLEATPPKTVGYSIALIALTFLLGVGKMLHTNIEAGTFQADHIGQAISHCIGMAILIGLVSLLLRGIYRGSKLALCIFLIHQVIYILKIEANLARFHALNHQWERSLYLVQALLQVIAAILLVSPKSWRWFYPKASQA